MLKLILSYSKKLLLPFIMIISVSVLIKCNNKLKLDNERLSENLVNSNFEIKKIKTKSNELAIEVQNLVVTNSELKKINKELDDDIKDLKVSNKKLTYALSVKPKIEYVTNTVVINDVEKTDSLYKANFNNVDDDIIIKGRLSIPLKNNSILIDKIKIDNLSVKLQPKFTITVEEKTKGIWFWKRVTGFKTKIKSDNKYINFEEVKSYNFKK